MDMGGAHQLVSCISRSLIFSFLQIYYPYPSPIIQMHENFLFSYFLIIFVWCGARVADAASLTSKDMRRVKFEEQVEYRFLNTAEMKRSPAFYCLQKAITNIQPSSVVKQSLDSSKCSSSDPTGDSKISKIKQSKSVIRHDYEQFDSSHLIKLLLKMLVGDKIRFFAITSLFLLVLGLCGPKPLTHELAQSLRFLINH